VVNTSSITLQTTVPLGAHIYLCCSFNFFVWNTIFMHLKLNDFYFTLFFSGMGWYEHFEVTSSLEDIDVTWKPMMIVLWRQMLWTGSISIWRTTQTLALMFQGNVTQVKVLSAGSFWMWHSLVDHILGSIRDNLVDKKKDW